MLKNLPFHRKIDFKKFFWANKVWWRVGPHLPHIQYSSEFLLYRVRLQMPAKSEALGRGWGGDHEEIKRWRPMKGRLWHMDAGQVQEGENGGRRIHRLSHYTVKRFKRFSRPQPGCHWLNSPWAENRLNFFTVYYLRIYYYRRYTSWSPPFNFPMGRREFTRVIFLSSVARVSKLLRIIPFRICFALSNLYIHIVYTAQGIYSRDLKIIFRETHSLQNSVGNPIS